MKKLLQHIKKLELVLQWKYWPTLLFYSPIMAYVMIIGTIRARRFFYFAAVNPKVKMGGLSGDSKYDSLKHVPEENLPVTLLIDRETPSFEIVERLLMNSGIQFPLIVKPDLGERGLLVKKLHNIEQLEAYHYAHDMAYLIQEYIAAPMEFSLLMHNANGPFTISSLIEKRYLRLVGDGSSTIAELLSDNNSARFKADVTNSLAGEMDRVLAKGEIYIPITIGNWSYGTEFIDLRHEIDAALEKTFTDINKKVGLFNYARYDVKADSLQDLKLGNFSVMEINGAKGEPLHIYTEKIGLWSAYADAFRHWEYIFTISMRNIKQGAKTPGFMLGARTMIQYEKDKKTGRRPRLRNNVQFTENVVS